MLNKNISMYPKNWKRDILKFISQKNKTKHKDIIEILFNEIEDMYISDINNAVRDMQNQQFTISLTTNCHIQMKNNMRNELQNNSFKKNRKLIKEKYFLYHRVVKNIISAVLLYFPPLICNLKLNRNIGVLPLKDYEKLITSQIEKNCLKITNKYYVTVARELSQCTDTQIMPERSWKHFIRCITNVFVQKILDLMMKSVDHVINVIDDVNECPRLELKMVHDNHNIIVLPDLKNIEQIFRNILISIESFAKNLSPLEEWTGVRAKQKYIKIELPEWFICNAHEKFNVIITRLCKPIKDHVIDIISQFDITSQNKIKDEISMLLLKKPDLSSYRTYIEQYNTYFKMADKMLDYVYFSIGTLDQKAVKESLKKHAFETSDQLIQTLVVYHYNMNKTVCTEFENIKSKLLNIPNNTNLLIELIEYASQASKVLMKELEKQITESMDILSLLLDVTVLTDDHIELNKRTVNWLVHIQPIFTQSNILCEAMKSELEDDLQKRINIVNNDVQTITSELYILDEMDDVKRTTEYMDHFKDLIKRTSSIYEQVETINTEEKLLKFSITMFPKVIELQDVIIPFYTLIKIINHWQRNIAVWLHGPFENLNANVIKDKTLNYFDTITEMCKTFKAKIKMDVSTNKSFKFSGIADDPDPMQQPAPLKLCWQVLKEIDNFRTYLPLVVCMCNPALTDRHLKEMSSISGFDLTPNAGTTLQKIIQLDLVGEIKKYEVISMSANKELALRKHLTSMINEWSTITFEMNCTNGATVFSNEEAIEVLLERQLMQIDEIKTSYFFNTVSSEVNDLVCRLSTIQAIVREWNIFQSKQTPLSPIFRTSEITGNLLEGKKIYEEAAELLVAVQQRIMEDTTFQKIGESVHIVEDLRKANYVIEEASEVVKLYIEEKKHTFPRLFFLSNKEIQQMIFQNNSPHSITECIQNCFSGIKTLKFDKNGKIKSVVGYGNDIMRLKEPIAISNSLIGDTAWLNELETEMQNSVRRYIQCCYNKINNENLDWILKYPISTVLCSFYLYWSNLIHNSIQISNDSLQSCQLECENLITSLTCKLQNCVSQQCRIVFMVLITSTINMKDVICLLLENNIKDATSFEWVAQLRYYWQDENVKVSIMSASIKYGYEYDSMRDHIITTPLTDRCFRTISEAYHYHLYSSIVGSAGSGKTEIFKALVKYLAMPSFICYCNENYKFSYLLQLMSGMISCGAWILLENFDKLNPIVISAIAQQFISISQALSSISDSLLINGNKFTLNTVGYMCITTGITSVRYTYLPDSLKRYFRTISTLKPDFKKITEVSFFAAGFSNSSVLAGKLYMIYEFLSSCLLDEFRDMIWIRSLISVIKTVIKLKHNHLDENEEILLLRTLIDVNIPMLTNRDVVAYQLILQEIFPNIVLPPSNFSSFFETLKEICDKKHLHISELFKLKIVQLFESIFIQPAVVITGEPLVGKTEMINVLKDIFMNMNKKNLDIGADVILETINPGASSVHELYGKFDEKNNIWNDGLCMKILRSFEKSSPHYRKWLHFDGSLTGEWIEYFHSILDSQKSLDFPNCNKVTIKDRTSIIFETININEVSPSIVSMCSIIYISITDIDWKPYVETFFATDNTFDDHNAILHSLIEWSLEPSLNFLFENTLQHDPSTKLKLVQSTLHLLSMYFKDVWSESTDKDKAEYRFIWYQIIIILSINWGLGGNLEYTCLVKFNKFLVSFWSGSNKDYAKPKSIERSNVILPADGLIHDHYYVFKGSGSWKNWNEVLKSENALEFYDDCEKYVSTTNLLKYKALLSMHIKHKKQFLLYGDSYTGKTTIMRNLLRSKLTEDRYLTNIITFDTMTDVTKAKKIFMLKLNKIKSGLYSTQGDNLCINFIDDYHLNLQSKTDNKFVFELTRQYLSKHQWYFINEEIISEIKNIFFIFALTTGLYKNNVCSRFRRYFHEYMILTPVLDDIFRIASNILSDNLKRNLFGTDVSHEVNSIVNATIEVYKGIIQILKPVPKKMQYSFNTNDILRVIDGCGLIHKESVENKIVFLKLWVHETWRVFGDRVTDRSDKDILFTKIRESANSCFKEAFETAFDHLPKSDNQLITNSFEELFFSNFVNSESLLKDRKYEEITSIEILKSKLINYLNEYNKVFRNTIDVVVCRDMIEKIVRVARILKIPGENLILIGPNGCGKKSAVKIASFIQRCELFEPSIQSCCNTMNWRFDLKNTLMELAENRKKYTFLLIDRQIDESFLPDICSLLSIGEVPNLFDKNERQLVIERGRLRAQNGDRNAEVNSTAVMRYFASECKRNIHFVMNFCTSSELLKTIFKYYPALIKFCSISSHVAWPDEVLTQIATFYTRDVKLSGEIKDNTSIASVKFYRIVQEESLNYYNETNVRNYHTTTGFLHMIKLFINLMRTKQDLILSTRKRYLAGLERLEVAAQEVVEMKSTLTTLKPRLEESARQAEITLKEIETENVSVERATVVVKQEEEIANRKTEIAGTLRRECEAELAVAIPILEDAVGALNTLKPTDITLVKAMKNPPDTVKLVMAAVCVMLEIPPDRSVDPVDGKKIIDYWSASKRILGDMNFLQNLKDYDKDDIPTSVMQTIKKTYINDRCFVPEIVANASSAAEGLCKWVRAMVSYDEIAKAVAPKKEKLAAAQSECDEAEAFLNEKRKTLLALSEKLEFLNNELREIVRKKKELEKEVTNCTTKLTKAEALIESLADEKDRWMRRASELAANHDNLAGDLLLSCAHIAYLTFYVNSFQSKILCAWSEFLQQIRVPKTKVYSLTDILGDKIEMSDWHLSGLSRHIYIAQNAIASKNSLLWCLFVDPERRANSWIRKIEKNNKNNLTILKLYDSGYIEVLRKCISNGTPVLLENIENTLDVALQPILRKKIYECDGKMFIDIQNERLIYNDNFHLYITTRLANPSFSEDIYHEIIVVDFSLSGEAMQEKLIDVLLSKENPKLQETLQNMFIQDANNKKILKNTEDDILNILSLSKSSFLEDEKAIRAMDDSKSLLIDIIKKQEVAKITKYKIYTHRKLYTQLADYCVKIYKILITLSRLDRMYQFSFSWFLRLYIRAIENSKRSAELDKRLEFLKLSFTTNLRLSVCNSLFEEHKLIFAFLLRIQIMSSSNEVSKEEINFFYTPKNNQMMEDVDNPITWLTNGIWNEIHLIDGNVSAFKGLKNHFLENQATWKIFFDSKSIRLDLIPSPWSKNLTEFQKLLLVKILKPNFFVAEVTRLVDEDSHDYILCSPEAKISLAYEESSCFNPIVYLLPSCRSPLSLISSFARKMKCSSKFIHLSLGDNQYHNAEQLIEVAKRDGSWILLDNCHLCSANWLRKVEKICENMNLSNTSVGFCLWFTTRSVEHFPLSILQNSVKISFKKLRSLKYNLLSIYQTEPISKTDFFEDCPGKEKIFAKLLYGLCFFHMIISDRTFFRARGWYIPYEFGYHDLFFSIDQLKNIINQYIKIPYKAISYVIGECNYGGKFFNITDIKLLRFLLEEYSNFNILKNSSEQINDDCWIPERYEYNDVIKFVKNLPLDTSEVLNINETTLDHDMSIFLKFLDSLLIMNEISSTPVEKSDEDILTIIEDVSIEIPDSEIVLELINNDLPYWMDSLHRFTVHEIEINNYILLNIKSSLKNLKLAYSGDSILTEEMKELSYSICNKRIPIAWKQLLVTSNTTKLSKFLNDLKNRFEYLKKWIKNKYRQVIYINHLLCPRMFFLTVLLSYAKLHNINPVTIELHFEVTTMNDSSDVDIKNEYEFFILGFNLLGATWDSKRNLLSDDKTNSSCYNMPIIRLNFEQKYKKVFNVYYCPVYTTIYERNLLECMDCLITIPLNTNVSYKYWINRNVSLFCSID